MSDFIGYLQLGGRPWKKEGKVKRIYFKSWPPLRGQAAWQEANPKKSMPEGYFDCELRRWVSQCHWSDEDYAALMEPAIRRGTLAPALPNDAVYTRDGVAMAPGMIVMFVGGKIPHRPHWGTARLINRLAIAGHRAGGSFYGDKGREVCWGQSKLPVLEHADHRDARDWCIHPLNDEPFEIEGKACVATVDLLFVAPAQSLISVDGGRRLAKDAPIEPAPEKLVAYKKTLLEQL